MSGRVVAASASGIHISEQSLWHAILLSIVVNLSDPGAGATVKNCPFTSTYKLSSQEGTTGK